ncbi:pimeloyl-[acyl-carrier protein] methyl ester esterase [Rhodoblastus sphagnicola]|uniref:alpha/beta fold hydrolase n=3 Tax=Rhodoblastus sphagnicola TaxID=333368 RepID=UPI001621C4A4|nr:alpha/beta hydrolase [Rhodoblastus sphagnicola]MBB4198183.1 pimeloyl-[acyl-carrier protein] methyl ester esterase [Rhodoblastus sphagnicola]
MRLYFVHGWAFGPDCFDALAPLLGDWPQARADLGYFGPARIPDFMAGDVLVGHSAGFGGGLSRRRDWAGVVAINAFSRFVLDEEGRGCVRPAELRALRRALARDPAGCVAAFRARHDGGACGAPNVAALAEGLDFLETVDVCPADGPALVLAAEDDPLVPLDASRNLAQSGGELWLSATGGHGLPWTAPAFCAETIKDFLRRHGW